MFVFQSSIAAKTASVRFSPPNSNTSESKTPISNRTSNGCASGGSGEAIWEHLPVLWWGSAGVLLLLQQLCLESILYPVPKGILTGRRHNQKCSQFCRSTQTWSSEMRRQVLARAIKEDFRGIFQLPTSGKAAGALFHQYSLDHQWILAFHDISQVFPAESDETWELLESTLCLWCWFSP